MTPDAELDLMRRYVDACRRDQWALRTRLEAELDALDRATNGRLDAPDALLKAALWYCSVGVAVFPCEPNGKRPVSPHGFKDASTDVDVIRNWWAVCPESNIGAPTGHTFDVIDIDGPVGVSHTYGNGVQFPPEIGHALTTRDGGHHIYVAPSGRGNAAGIMPGVDYRGIGGYCIVPPSRGANGRRYVWTTPLDVTALRPAR